MYLKTIYFIFLLLSFFAISCSSSYYKMAYSGDYNQPLEVDGQLYEEEFLVLTKVEYNDSIYHVRTTNFYLYELLKENKLVYDFDGYVKLMSKNKSIKMDSSQFYNGLHRLTVNVNYYEELDINPYDYLDSSECIVPVDSTNRNILGSVIYKLIKNKELIALYETDGCLVDPYKRKTKRRRKKKNKKNIEYPILLKEDRK